MHIRDVRDKRRLVIKATDVVLFGPPQGIRDWKMNFLPSVWCRITESIERYDSNLGIICFNWWMYLCISSTTTNSGEYEYHVERIGYFTTSGRKSISCDREVTSPHWKHSLRNTDVWFWRMRTKESETKDKKIHVHQNLLHKWLMEVQRTKVWQISIEYEDIHREFRMKRIDFVNVVIQPWIMKNNWVLHYKKSNRFVANIPSSILFSSIQLQIALHQAEEHAQNQSYEPSNELIELLKRTYNMEEIAFEVKRKIAETALITAKDQVNEPSLLVTSLQHWIHSRWIKFPRCKKGSSVLYVLPIPIALTMPVNWSIPLSKSFDLKIQNIQLEFLIENDWRIFMRNMKNVNNVGLVLQHYWIEMI